jgi:hypothetical protein
MEMLAALAQKPKTAKTIKGATPPQQGEMAVFGSDCRFGDSRARRFVVPYNQWRSDRQDDWGVQGQGQDAHRFPLSFGAVTPFKYG